MLTADTGTSTLAPASSAQSCLVEVARHEGEIPALTAHTPPAIRRRTGTS